MQVVIKRATTHIAFSSKEFLKFSLSNLVSLKKLCTQGITKFLLLSQCSTVSFDCRSLYKHSGLRILRGLNGGIETPKFNQNLQNKLHGPGSCVLFQVCLIFRVFYFLSSIRNALFYLKYLMQVLSSTSSFDFVFPSQNKCS